MSESPADLPVAAPDPANAIRRLIDEAVALQAADPEPENTERRFTELRDDLVVAALYELPALLAERQQDKERIERLEAALNEARPYVEWMAAGPRDAADDASTAKAVLAQVDAALAVEKEDK